MKQEMMGWQWHQLDHMQIICALLQTDNHGIDRDGVNMVLVCPKGKCHRFAQKTGMTYFTD